MYISSRHKQQIIPHCDYDIIICDNNIHSYLFVLSRIKQFHLEGTEYCFTTYILPQYDLCCIICGNCSSTLEDKLVKFHKRAARVILDCDFYTPSPELFKQLNWQTFP